MSKVSRLSKDEGRSLLFSYVGFVVPGLLALVILPILVDALGLERFSLFNTLFVVGIFMAGLDLGIAASVAKQTAESIVRGDNSTDAIFKSAMVLQVGLGLFACFAGELFYWVSLKDDIVLRSVNAREFELAFIAMLVGILPTLLASVCRGYLEGHKSFKSAAMLRLASGSVALLLPLLLALFVTNLVVIFVGVALGRFLLFLLALLFCVRSSLGVSGAPKKNARFDAPVARTLLSYGAWVSLGHVTAGIITMGVADRLFLSSALYPDEVLFYTLPRDIIGRLLLIPASLSVILLPKLVAKAVNNPSQKLNSNINQVFVIQIFPFCLILSLLSPELLHYFTKSVISDDVILFFDLLILGVIPYMGTYVLHTNLLAQGMPKISAIRHLYQIPIYVVISYYLASHGEILKLGYLWLLWCLSDLLMLEWLSNKYTKVGFSSLHSYKVIILASALFLIVILIKPFISDVFRYVLFLFSVIALLLNIIITARKSYVFYELDSEY